MQLIMQDVWWLPTHIPPLNTISRNTLFHKLQCPTNFTQNPSTAIVDKGTLLIRWTHCPPCRIYNLHSQMTNTFLKQRLWCYHMTLFFVSMRHTISWLVLVRFRTVIHTVNRWYWYRRSQSRYSTHYWSIQKVHSYRFQTCSFRFSIHCQLWLLVYWIIVH